MHHVLFDKCPLERAPCLPDSGDAEDGGETVTEACGVNILSSALQTTGLHPVSKSHLPRFRNAQSQMF